MAKILIGLDEMEQTTRNLLVIPEEEKMEEGEHITPNAPERRVKTTTSATPTRRTTTNYKVVNKETVK